MFGALTASEKKKYDEMAKKDKEQCEEAMASEKRGNGAESDDSDGLNRSTEHGSHSSMFNFLRSKSTQSARKAPIIESRTCSPGTKSSMPNYQVREKSVSKLGNGYKD